MKRIIILFTLLFAWLQAAQAGGFQIGEMSSRSTGMGSAFTAVADDASAAWHNPAGAAFSSGSELMLGGAAIIVPSADFSSNTSNPLHPRSTSASSQTFFVPHGYFTFMDQGSRLGATLGLNAPFGLETDWPTTGPFATKNTFSRIQMVMINPSIVFKFTDNIAIAAGVDYAYLNNVDLNNTLQHMNGNGDGWGGNASIMYKDDTFSFGVTYRSSVKVDLDGVARAFSTLATLGGTTSAVTSKVTLPYQLNVGLAFRPSSDWIISLDVDSVGWQSYDSVKITYASAAYRTAVATLQGAVGAAPTGATYLPQNWTRTTAIRVGAEWAYNARMRARFGYVFDPTPINDVDFSPSVPGNDRQLFSVGYGYDFNPNATIDLAYAYVYFKNRDQTASPATPVGAPDSVKNGLYKSDSHIVAASFSYKF